MKTIAIMQPTYLPWMGYFDMIAQVDCFVFLDSVQFNKRSWQQRNRIKGHDGVLWLTVPVLTKGRRYQRIFEVVIAPTQDFQKEHVKTIRHVYRTAPYFAQYFDELTSVLLEPQQLLVDLNIELIGRFCSKLGIGTDMMLSSSLDVEGKNVELLVDICKALKADRYLSATGSKDYIDENNLFASSDIDLIYHDYQHPEYRQLYEGFVSHLSVLDILFNEGPSSLSIIRGKNA